MGFFNWLAGLLGGKADETPKDVADRIDRYADRFAHAGDPEAEQAARIAAGEARLCGDAESARDVERAFLRDRGLGADGRPVKPVRGERGGTEYVRYGNGLKAGGSRAWRYNNPGYVRCTDRSVGYGAIGCDGEYAIFPDERTGYFALHQALRDEYPGHTVRDALQHHLPAEAGPGAADRVVEKSGLDPAAKVEDLGGSNVNDLGAACREATGWEPGETFEPAAGGGPDWAADVWNETTPSSDVSADESAPTDNS